MNFISDDSVKDKIVSWQETMAATKENEASEKQNEDKKKEDVPDANATEDSNESKTILTLS